MGTRRDASLALGGPMRQQEAANVAHCQRDLRRGVFPGVHASMKRLVKSPRCSRHRGLILGRLPVSARRPLTQLRGRARERVLLKPCRRSSNSVPRRTIPARSLILLSALSVAPSAPAHHTGCEWRSGAPCVPALTCGQGMHTRSLLQLDDHAVTRSYAMAAVTAGASPVNTAARRRAGW